VHALARIGHRAFQRLFYRRVRRREVEGLARFEPDIWLHVEKQPAAKVGNHAWYTFWYVVPTLPMFLVFPALLQRLGFWPALAVCVVLTVVCFAVFAAFVKRFGVSLM
jgi:hypothetical protein